MNQGPHSDELRRLPANLDAERAVLGSILLKNHVLFDVCQRIDASSFYDAGHREIYSAIKELEQQEIAIDPTTLSNALAQKGMLEQAGGLDYILRLESFVLSTSNVTAHANVVRDKRFKRKLIEACHQLAERAYNEDDDATGLLVRATADVQQLVTDAGDNESDGGNAADLIDDFMERKRGEASGEIVRKVVHTPFIKLNEILDGLRTTNLVVIGGRTSHGKTAFGVNIARGATLATVDPSRTIFFSAEMSKDELLERLIVNDIAYRYAKQKQCPEWRGVPLGRLRNPTKLTDSDMAQVEEAAARIKGSEYLDIIVKPGMDIADIEAIATRGKLQHNDLRLIVVDYIQMIQNRGFNVRRGRHEEVGDITDRLKALAKRLDICVIALAQLGRAVEQRSKKEREPILSDLRESGSLEQTADVVIYVYQPEFYPKDGKPKPNAAKARILVRKYRNGRTGSVEMELLGEQQIFLETET